MVGEEMSLRNRLSKASEKPEGKEDQGNPTKESLESPNNGRLDIKHLIAKKIQLTAEAEELKPFFMKEVGTHFDDFVTNLIEKSASLDNGGCALTTFSVLEGENNHRAKDLRAPPEHGKIFVVRRSLLDELFEVDHIRTIYHMFIALLILFILSTLVVDYIDEGRLVLEFSLMSYAFGKLPVAIWTWCAMFLCTLSLPYFLFQHWARGYSKSSHPVIHSVFHGLLFMVFQIGILGLGPTCIVLAYTLPPASRCIVIFEQIRLIMKAHSFVRENVPRILNSAKEKSGVLILFLTFFAFLHCWLNAFAEMLRFGDRMFYKDWWNSTSYSNYYRTWNVVVHDWLYYYAYKDFLWFFTKRFRSAAMLAVFAVSAVVHEYALAVCLSFFYPVLFVLFMFFGMAFNFIVNDSRKRPIWNVMMWTSLFAGNGVLLCLYSQEWYARQHCPLKNPTFLDYIRPRSWTCRYVF
ncbi:PREDICTED: sterol O-acyltransferase 1 isoform X2 [Hipposideros armiger]|uniref:O-acyltransferase n=1 Tax=Hipposideros armiger TaxID=186990 RepID=A0A8B7RPJ2_HIPAR|nr:PREDICTED: sterol O-acyltransferase 1 isoform X2 [Hipposideros armiger]